jgi:hypothetical protein
MGGSHDKTLINQGSTAPEFSAFRPIEINGLRYILRDERDCLLSSYIINNQEQFNQSLYYYRHPRPSARLRQFATNHSKRRNLDLTTPTCKKKKK